MTSNLFILERHKLTILYADDILIIAPSITGLDFTLYSYQLLVIIRFYSYLLIL